MTAYYDERSILGWLEDVLRRPLSATAKNVAAVIALDCIRGTMTDTWQRFRSQDELARALGVTPRTIKRALRELQSANVITVSRPGTGRRNSTYRLLLEEVELTPKGGRRRPPRGAGRRPAEDREDATDEAARAMVRDIERHLREEAEREEGGPDGR